MIFRTTVTLALLALSTFAQDSRMDWRWGRPGVLLNTNLPTTVTINGVPWWTGTNGAFSVQGGEAVEAKTLTLNGVSWWAGTNGSFSLTAQQVGALSPEETTQVVYSITGPISTEMNYSNTTFSSWFERLFGRTNEWEEAYSWGPHAGLYRPIAWVPSIGDVPDLQSALDGKINAHTATGIVDAAVGKLPPSNTLTDRAMPAKYFQTLVNGTGTVWEVYLATNLMVAISPDFDAGGVRPDWSTNVFPFVDGYWAADLADSGDGYYDLSIGHNEEPYAAWTGDTIGGFPVLLTSIGENANGTAIVYETFTAITNLYATFATAAERQAIEARLAIIEADTLHPSDIASVINPSTVTFYGSNTTTNDTGFGSLQTNNPATRVEVATIDPVAGQVLAAYQYRITQSRLAGVTTLSHYLRGVGATSTATVETVVEVFSPVGAILSSNRLALAQITTGLNKTTNVTASFNVPSVTSGGVFRITLRATESGTRDVYVATGGAEPLTLTLPVVPLQYVPSSQLDTKIDSVDGMGTGTRLTNPIVSGSLLANGIDAAMDMPVGYMFGARNNNLCANIAAYQPWSSATTTNDFVIVAGSVPSDSHLQCRLFYLVGDPIAATNGVTILAGWGGVQSAPSGVNLFTVATNQMWYSASSPDPRKYIDFVIPPKPVAETSPTWLWLYAIKPYQQGIFATTGIRIRRATSAEITTAGY